MVSALNGFGLAIGIMDIIGAVFFELTIVCILWRRKVIDNKQAKATGDNSKTTSVTLINNQFNPALYGRQVGYRMLWIYLILLNIWVLASGLLISGILLKKPQLLIFWLIWCLGGLILDGIFLLWWLWELITGDSIEALTNILISILTMGKFRQSK